MHQLIADQYMAAKSLDDEIGSLAALLERAKLLMSSGTPEAARWAKAMMREAKAKLDQIRHRYAQDYSLAQTNSSAAQEDAWSHALDVLQRALPALKRGPH